MRGTMADGLRWSGLPWSEMQENIRDITGQVEWKADSSRVGPFQKPEKYLNLTVDFPSEISIGSPKTQ